MARESVADHPALAPLWDTEANLPTTPSDLTVGSNRKPFWRCPLGHSFSRTPLAVLSSLAGGKTGCPVCSGRAVLSGYNDLATTHPELAAQWHPDNDKAPTEVSRGSGRKVRWRCPRGHEWTASVLSRTGVNRAGCPFCAGKRVLAGYNDLATTHPELASQWAGTGLSPTEVTAGSGKKVDWLCAEGHRWTAVVRNRAKGSAGCPYCAGSRPHAGSTDLATLHPEILAEWDDPTSPSEFTRQSGRKVWWKCPEGHRWKARVADWVGEKTYGCPCCSGRKVIPGETDLATGYPELVERWSSDNPLTPSEVGPRSGVMIRWVCPDGHEYEKTAAHMTSHPSCPTCYEGGSSEAEREMVEFIGGLVGDEAVVRNDRTTIPPYELDILVPEYDMAVEYNGLYWHSEDRRGREQHREKWSMCRDAGIRLLTIWEDEWRDREEVVKSMIRHKLGLATEAAVGARSCSVAEVSLGRARDFLDEYHIQGAGTPGSVRYGLVGPSGDLVAVSTYRAHEGTLYLDRYATGVPVPGGMGRLLAAGKRYAAENGCSRIVTFADHCVSDGGLYAGLGFTAEAEIPPDYRYVHRGVRHHKFGYRKDRFRRDPGLLWEEGLTERELAEINGLARIWDCGKTRWVLPV